MKHFLTITVFLFFVQLSVFASEPHSAAKESLIKSKSQIELTKISQNIESPKDTNKNYWGVFWINFVIAAVGIYFIYGFAAGIVSAGISYFVVDGDKRGFKMAIFGALAGLLVGLTLRLMVLFL